MAVPESGIQQFNVIHAEGVHGRLRAPAPVVHDHEVPAERGFHLQTARDSAEWLGNPVRYWLATRAAIGREVRQAPQQNEQAGGITVIGHVLRDQFLRGVRRNAQERVQLPVTGEHLVLVWLECSFRQTGGGRVSIEDPERRGIGEEFLGRGQRGFPHQKLAAEGATQSVGRHETPFAGDKAYAPPAAFLEQATDIAGDLGQQIASRTLNRTRGYGHRLASGNIVIFRGVRNISVSRRDHLNSR